MIYNKKTKTFILYALLLVIYSSFTYLLTYLISYYGETEFYNIETHLLTFIYSVVSLYSTILSVRLIKRKKVIKVRINEYLAMLILSILIQVMLSSVVFISMRKIYGGELYFLSVISNIFFTTFTFHLIISCFYLAMLFFNEKNQFRFHILELEKTQTASNLKILQQQLDPHFLFNNLNILSSLIHHRQNDQAEKFLDRFVDIYRYRLSFKHNELMKLSDELAHAEDYMYLIRERFESSYILQVNNNISEDVFIIPGTLQILLENVIKHNEANTQNPIEIIIDIRNEHLSVSNELRPKIFKENSTKTGLQNLNSLYELRINKSLTINENADDYYEVKVPLISKIKSS